nr:putative integron gene cassette protein [uncultured bacterium]
MNLDGSLDSPEIRGRDLPEPAGETDFAYGRELVGHGLPLFAAEGNVRLTRVETRDVTRQRYHLYAVEMLVRCIVADDHGRASLSDLAPNRRVETHPPDVTAFHRLGPKPWPQPTQARLSRGLHPLPSRGMPRPAPPR